MKVVVWLCLACLIVHGAVLNQALQLRLKPPEKSGSDYMYAVFSAPTKYEALSCGLRQVLFCSVVKKWD